MEWNSFGRQEIFTSRAKCSGHAEETGNTGETEKAGAGSCNWRLPETEFEAEFEKTEDETEFEAEFEKTGDETEFEAGFEKTREAEDLSGGTGFIGIELVIPRAIPDARTGSWIFLSAET